MCRRGLHWRCHPRSCRGLSECGVRGPEGTPECEMIDRLGSIYKVIPNMVYNVIQQFVGQAPTQGRRQLAKCSSGKRRPRVGGSLPYWLLVLWVFTVCQAAT